MIRTHDTFIDNGLFVAAHYLKTDYKHIDEKVLLDHLDSLVSPIHKTTEKIKEMKANKIEGVAFLNAPYFGYWHSAFYETLDPKKKNKKFNYNEIRKRYESLLNSSATDKFCIVCGKKKVPFHNNTGKDNYPSITSFQHYNSSNNLQTIDICPVCSFLASISFLNTVPIANKKGKIGRVGLVLSDNDAFMVEYTKERQRLITSFQFGYIDSSIKHNYITGLIEENDLLEMEDETGYVSITEFINNNSQNEQKEDALESREIRFILDLKKKRLIGLLHGLNIMRSYWSTRNFIRSFTYQHHNLKNLLEDKNKRERRHVMEDLKDLGEEILAFELPPKVKCLHERLMNMINFATGDTDKYAKELNLCDTQRKFTNIMLNIAKKSKEPLTEGEFYEITRPTKWWEYKTLIQFSFIIGGIIDDEEVLGEEENSEGVI